jgi:hypothetical protein
MEIGPDSFIRNFIKKYYRVIFRSGLPEVMMLLVLFASGLARYRVVLVFAIGDPLRALRMLLEARGEERVNWKFVRMAWSLMVMLALTFDMKYGPLFYEYPSLPIWGGVIAVAAGFILPALILNKVGGLAQKLSGNAVFRVCPACGHFHSGMVDRCGNCGFTDGISPPESVRQSEPPEDLKNEIEEYRKTGQLRKIPKEALAGLNLLPDEYILMAMKGARFEGAKKYDGSLRPGWFFMTTQKIACYRSVAGGWIERDFIPYGEITGVDIVKDKFVFVLQYTLRIDTQKGSWQFFFGSSWQKYFRRIFSSGRLTNKPALREIFCCIEKRRQGAPAQAFNFELPYVFPELPSPLVTPKDAFDLIMAAGKPGVLYLGSFLFAPVVFLVLYISGLGWRFSLLFSLAGRFHRPLELLYLLVPVFGIWLAFKGYESGLQKKNV